MRQQAMRQGTKSCSECRQRKLKCIKDSETDPTCTNCKERGRICVPQQFKPRAARQATPGDRIASLEQRIASLTAAFKEQRSDHASFSSSNSGPDAAGSSVEAFEAEKQAEPHTEPSPPAHLALLFNNVLLGSDQIAGTSRLAHVDDVKCSQPYLDRARERLSRLLPSRPDVAVMAAWSSPWLYLYHTIFAPASALWERQDLVEQYDRGLSPSAHPLHLAVILLNLAITIQQVPPGQQPRLEGWRDVESWIKTVCVAVESVIISHLGIAGSIEGMETIIMYMRILLGMGHMRKIWLTLRRVIAIAELVGLPRAANAARRQRADMPIGQPFDNVGVINLWDSICVTDRMVASMLNLPAATATYRHAHPEALVADGQVAPQAYLYRLSEIAMRLQELDESYAVMGESATEILKSVLVADSELRHLAQQTPREWWEYENQELEARHFVQFWHFYFIARLHLHAAISSDDDHDQFRYNRMACIEACQTITTRYVVLRRLLPIGLFLARIFDMQAVTATVFLLLSCYDPRHGPDVAPRRDLIRRMVECMEAVAAQPGSDFAKEAASAVTSLQTLLDHPSSSSEHSLTVRVPLLGNVHISRKQRPHFDKSEGDVSSPTDGASTDKPVNHYPSDAEASAQPMMAPWLMNLDVNIAFQDPTIMTDMNNWDEWLHSMDVSL